MTDQHTPGPWHAVQWDVPADAQDCRESRVGAADWDVIGPAGDELIAHVGGNQDNAANARLIALAPQMLRALRGIVQDIQAREDWRDQIGYRISGEWWDMAVDAVNRMREVEGD